jgi:tRNA-dihydrouridine synthase 3
MRAMPSLRETLTDARLVMAPMTKGSNLPYRRLAVELGAKVLISEMVVARRLKQRRRGEFALVRRAPDEPCFAVQLAGTNPDEMAWAAAVAEARGADFVDVNLGCPIDHFTRKGMGAALARQPNRVAKIVRTMVAAVKVPVTVKIRLGWNTGQRNFLDVARAAVDGGAAAITVHGRTREARYRHPADWTAIGEVASAVPVPVVGNGDVLFPHEIADGLAASGCVAAMTARGALIKPWIFTEMTRGYWDITAEERVDIYRRYVTLAREHWGRATAPGEPAATSGEPPELDDHGRTRLREFLRWHVGFWCRYAPRRQDGTWPTMQTRESAFVPRSPLESLLARADEAALDYVTDALLDGRSLDDPPAPAATVAEEDIEEAG